MGLIDIDKKQKMMIAENRHLLITSKYRRLREAEAYECHIGNSR